MQHRERRMRWLVVPAALALTTLIASPMGRPADAMTRRGEVVRTSVPLSPLATQRVVTLNDNGAWSWFQDQRAIFTSDDRLLVGSVPNLSGSNGAARSSTIEATTYDTRTGRTSVDRIHTGFGNDDHDAPAFIETHPGRVVAAWTGHATESAIHVASENANSLTWDVPAPIPRPDTTGGKKVSYSNLMSLSSENHGRGRLYDFYRGEEYNPNLLISDDEGRSWRYGGRLLTVPGQRPYVRYSSNGTDRINFIASEGHPLDINGDSVRAGYVQGGRVHGTNGADLGPLDGSVRFDQLTRVFDGTPSGDGVESDIDAWPTDIEQDGAGRPVVAFAVRLPTRPAAPGAGRYDHRYYVGRWNGSKWQVHQVAFAGGELYTGQDDYTGTTATDPADPNRMFVSTNVDPRTGGTLVSAADGRPHWEIYEGRSVDRGATWSWRAVTHDSTADNIRPDVLTGPRGSWALLWLRGQYTNYVNYDLRVVGIVHGAPSSNGRVKPTTIGGTATVTAGRFSATGHDDLFVSGPGSAGDGFVLHGTPRHRLVAKQFNQTYALSAFNPQGSGPDTLIAVPADPTAAAQTFRLNPDTSITRGLLDRPIKTQPIVADVGGDGRDDILWYGPGSIPDQLWHTKPDGTFRIEPVTVNGNYRPVAGDFDGDGRDDIMWYAPGAASDSIWHFRPGGGHDNWLVHVKGDYRPVAGDFDGDGRDGIVWNAPGPAADYAWHFVGRNGLYVSARRFLPDTAQPSIGDFNGDHRDDIFWNATGDLPDAIWPRGIAPA